MKCLLEPPKCTFATGTAPMQWSQDQLEWSLETGEALQCTAVEPGASPVKPRAAVVEEPEKIPSFRMKEGN